MHSHNSVWKERAAAFGTFMAVVMVLFVAVPLMHKGSARGFLSWGAFTFRLVGMKGMPLGYVIPRGVALAISVAAGMAPLLQGAINRVTKRQFW